MYHESSAHEEWFGHAVIHVAVLTEADENRVNAHLKQKLIHKILTKNCGIYHKM
jgi:hypothetical protein